MHRFKCLASNSQLYKKSKTAGYGLHSVQFKNRVTLSSTHLTNRMDFPPRKESHRSSKNRPTVSCPYMTTCHRGLCWPSIQQMLWLIPVKKQQAYGCKPHTFNMHIYMQQSRYKNTQRNFNCMFTQQKNNNNFVSEQLMHILLTFFFKQSGNNNRFKKSVGNNTAN